MFKSKKYFELCKDYYKVINGFTVYTDTDGGYLITSSEQTYTLSGFYDLIKNKMYFERTMTVLEGVPINGTYLSELVWRSIKSV